MERRYKEPSVYRELTLAGVVLCAILGLGLESLLFIVMGIRVLEVPLTVLGFLWLLSGILASGVLKLTASIQQFV